jgi:prepilin-type N-terminal cleavage/methylation domain-containing protein
MKKMLSSKKGFTLTELLIVIAIIGILVVLAFGMFQAFLNNAKRDADRTMAKSIEKAISLYITKSGDSKLEDIRTSGDDAATAATVNLSTAAGQQAFLELLQQELFDAEGNSIGVILTPKTQDSTPDYKGYWVTWDSRAGGQHVGYNIIVDSSIPKVYVEPAVTTIASEIN